MILFKDISTLLTMEGAHRKDGRHVQEADLGIIENAAMIVDRGFVQWVGSAKKIPRLKKIKKEISLKAATLMPAFIECHTHSIFAGDRSAEFEMRNRGATYQEIAAKGGGILNTVRATRKSSEAELLKSAQARADKFVSQGVATLETKSGYALNEKDELKMLKVAGKLKGPEVVTTFLGAHALPPEFASHAEYLHFLAGTVLPKIKKAKLSKRVDIYIEKGFFPVPEGRKFLQTAKDLGFAITIHADQLSLSGGSELAMELGAASADHVIHLDASLINKFSKSTTTCVLLPTADLYLRCAYPPARVLINSGARVALATDFNPGTAPSQDLALVGLLARLEMKMSLPEVLAAYTVGAAHALNLESRKGALFAGMDADFISSEKSWSEFFYSPGKSMIQEVYRSGSRIYKG